MKYNIGWCTITVVLTRYVHTNQWVNITAIVVMMVCLVAMACCESVRRKAPTNFIFLGVFTVCEGIMLGTTAALYDVS